MFNRFTHAFVGFEILLSVALLGLAWMMPIMSVKTWFIFYQEVTIFQAAQKLYEDGFLLLAGLVFVFAIVFPALKLIVLLLAWRYAGLSGDSARTDGILKVFDHLGKWSMLDVFIVAVVVVSTQSSLVSKAEIHPGLYSFTASILVSMSAMFHVRYFRKRQMVTNNEAGSVS
jgi:paraquat-inducible protein A